jgi:hypothetical protein
LTAYIRASLALGVRLIDTTTGKALDEADARYYKDGIMLRPLHKGPGIWVFTNMDKEDFLMNISVRGYDDTEIKIEYEKLDPQLPMLDVFLMPSENSWEGGQVLEICGNLSKLEFIEAIALDRPICSFQSLVEKKGVYTMNLIPKMTGQQAALDRIKYAILSESGERYDVFEVQKQVTPTGVILKDPLLEEHKVNDRIYRIIYGKTDPKGRYSLRVRDDSDSLPHLLHFKAGNNEYFRLFDFHLEEKDADLLKGAIKQKAITEEEGSSDE